MADETPRLGLPIYTSGTDLHPTREDFNDRMALLEEAVAIARQGTSEDRPMPSTRGTLFMETDTRVLWFDTGEEWIRVLRVGNDGPGRAVDVGGDGSEGSSEWAARADHTHPLSLATASSPGALSAADKALLNTASANATSNALARRNGSGQMSTAAPSAAGHATNRGYVDTQVNTRAPSSHTHNASDVDRGVFGRDRIPYVTHSARGAMYPEDKLRLDRASSASGATGQIMSRNSEGQSGVGMPTHENHAANKRYVDAEISGHRHTAAHTTSGTFDPARLPSATQSVQGALSADDKAKLDRATSDQTPGTLVERNSSGYVSMVDPTSAVHVANKGYVDQEVRDRLEGEDLGTRNLNDITRVGVYYVANPANYTPGRNYPGGSNEHGLLEVLPTGLGAGQFQRFTRASGSHPMWIRRRYVNGNWSDWIHDGGGLITVSNLFDSLESGYTAVDVVGMYTPVTDGLARVEASFAIPGVTFNEGGQNTRLGTVAAAYRGITSIPVTAYTDANRGIAVSLNSSGNLAVRWVSGSFANWNLFITFSHLVESG